MASKKTPPPAQEKPVPKDTPTPPPGPPPEKHPPTQDGAAASDQTLVLQERIADLAGGRVVRATEDQAKSLMAAGRARKATVTQIANQAGRIPALAADTPLTQTEKD